jgi:AcrR family transcriptional regulator
MGLRERKKVKTRTTIQQQALRLFREQGYEATTVSQIAEVAEVSESTFFRYFPTKEDILLWDEFDPMIIEVIRAQPAGVKPIASLRGAIHDIFGRLSAEERETQRERIRLLLSIPPLRAVEADKFSGPIRLLTEVIAERSGRKPDDLAVRTLVGAVIGAGIAAMFSAVEKPNSDLLQLVDEALTQLEAGFPL